MNDNSLVNQVSNTLNDIVENVSNYEEVFQNGQQEEDQLPVAPTTPTVKDNGPIETVPINGPIVPSNGPIVTPIGPIAPTNGPIVPSNGPSVPTEAVVGTPTSAKVTPTTSTSGTSGVGIRRKKEMVAHEVPTKKSRQDQEEIIKLLTKRIEEIEKEIELGHRVLQAVEKVEQTVETLQKNIGINAGRQTAGLHSELKKNHDENVKHHQGLRTEVHSNARKIEGLVHDSATVKDLLGRIRMVADDSRQLLITKLAVAPTPAPTVVHSIPVAPRESSSNQWSTPNLPVQVQEYEQVKENVSPQQYPPCAFCSLNNHPSEKCNKFPTWKARRNLLHSQSRCWLCLGSQHDGEQCPQEGISCQTCVSLYPPKDSRALHHEAICENHYLGQPIEALTANFIKSNRGKAPSRGRGRGRGRGNHRGKLQ
ncbi:unnamed protein product [Caenorhabditis nigoni]